MKVNYDVKSEKLSVNPNISKTNFETKKLEELTTKKTQNILENNSGFETKRIKRNVGEYSEKVMKNMSVYRMSVNNILNLQEGLERIEKVEELIYLIDEKLKSGQKITLMPEYDFFSKIYFELSDLELRYINSGFVSSHGSIFDEFRKIFLKERILGELNLSNHFNIRKRLVEYENIDGKLDEEFLFDGVSEEKKQKILKYLKENNQKVNLKS